MNQKPLFFGALFAMTSIIATSVYILASTLGGFLSLSEGTSSASASRPGGGPGPLASNFGASEGQAALARPSVVIREVDIVVDRAEVSGEGTFFETEVRTIPASEWIQERYELGYFYDGPSLVDAVASAETAARNRAKGGELSPASREELALREEQLLEHFPELAATVDRFRTEREEEAQRFAASGAGPNERAMAAGVLLED